MSKVNLSRILELADAVEAFGNRFDFRFWTKGWDGRPNTCGTVACALGLAVEKWGAECGVIFYRCSTDTAAPAWTLSDDDGGDYTLEAAYALFGELSEPDFEVLFVPLSMGGLHGSATAKEWAEHARRWVARFPEGTYVWKG
jgi:hypothetical protein